jgi:hypothetical protein
VQELSALLRPGGRLLVIDYERHGDEVFRERQADVWNGFEAGELEAHGRAAGLRDVRVSRIPQPFVNGAIGGHLGWQVLVGRRPEAR